MRFAERSPPARVSEDEAHAVVVEQLGGSQRREPATELRRERGCLARVVDRQQCDGAARQLGYETEADAGDDGQGALGSGEQRRQRIASVVLHETGKAPDHRSVREDRLDPHDLLAHHAVPEHVYAAGVGGDHASHRGGIARAHVHPEHPAGPPDVLLQKRKGRPGPHGHLPRDLIDRLQVAKAQGREDDLGPRRAELIAGSRRPAGRRRLRVPCCRPAARQPPRPPRRPVAPSRPARRCRV